ncbi:hypothetical protein DRW48_08150 [Paracoccus suum]|uniref:Uncharacterized protein n=1 Tax=Paracoccus suum TaxID=2259340 RepID=A0A344PJW1_9RHOB|nr:hypothetical protein [Paracoccus suum]AXC49666.1 hypothetical protein DRW48_08150 [Paracoccus suum]
MSHQYPLCYRIEDARYRELMARRSAYAAECAFASATRAVDAASGGDADAAALREMFRRQHIVWASRASYLAELEDDCFRFPEDRR